MAIRIEMTLEELEGHMDNYDGICTNCGKWSEGDCEPDAQNYKCAFCGQETVVGAEEAVLQGYITLS